MLQKIVNKLSSNPQKLFLVDGLGAVLSAFLLGVVLVHLESFFGIPRQTLYILAFLPCIFAIYDFTCYLRIKKNAALFLRIIAYINLLYCCISIGFACYHHQELTLFGWGYIILEIAIVMILVFVELKTANEI